MKSPTTLTIDAAGRRRPARAAATLIAAGVAFLGAAAAGGCNLVGPFVAIAAGPPETPAQFTLDAKRAHILFLDDPRSRIPKRSLRELTGKAFEETLLGAEALPSQMLIASTAVTRATSDDKAGSTLSVVEIGRRVGADVVIYAVVDVWTISRDGASLSPEVRARVKVIDAAKNARLWPRMDEGYTLVISPGRQQGNLPLESAPRSAQEQELSRRLGVALAQLFFEHETRTSARE